MIVEVRLKLNSPLLPAIVVLLALVQLLRPYDGWLILLAGFGGAWLSAYLWVRQLAKHLKLQREMRFGWTQVGDRLEERFTLINTGLVPGLWVEVQDETTLPGYRVSRVTGIGGISRNAWITQGVCEQRGVFRLGPTTLMSGDPLGIYTVIIHDPRTADLMVTPPIVPLPSIEVAPGGRSGEGRPRPDAPERSASAAMVREYVPGDSLRWVHWKTTARRDDLFVRLFDGTPASDWWILLDLDRRHQAGTGLNSTEEHAVMLAASLADRGLRLKRPVGLAANASRLVWETPREGDGQRWQILRALALASPGERPLSEVLARLRTSFGRHSSLILITANVTGDWVEDLLPLLWSGIAPTALLLDPRSFGGATYAAPLATSLSGLGIANHVIDRELLDRPEARPGQAGRWEWRVSPTGRAVAIRKPQDLEWRTLK